MADFIIKSAAGTGNKTLIQGQDQSGSNYAIQVGDAGASTLHNATLTTATITAGTFPAGHVIQQLSSIYDPGASNISTSSTDFQASGLFLTITPTNAANDICMCFHINGFLQSNAGANAIVDIQRSINGGGYTRMGGSNTYAFAHTYNTNSISTGIVFTDTDFSSWTTGTIVYKLFYRTDNASHAMTFVRALTDNCAWAMEIKR